VKTLTFFGSFLILFFLVVSVVRTYADIHSIVHTIVVCATIVAFFGLIESRTHFNIFNHLHPLLPGLQFQDPAYTAGLTPDYLNRSGVERIYASSAHPIELSAVLVMVIPLATYLKRATGQRRWVVAAVLLALATLATLSRTGFLMMLVTLLVFLWLRPVETRRLWPWLVPVVLASAIAVPHTLSSLYSAFFPKGGLIAQQDQRNVGSNDGGRLADVGPSLREYEQHPFLGEGFGTRISQRLGVLEGRVTTTARILDDQWLGSLLETGAIGFVALVWLFLRPIRRLARKAKGDDGPEGWLAAALTASLTSFAISMLTFDAFGFVQVTILTFLLLAIGASLLNLAAPEPRRAARR
jgi:O-antigen ligase